MLISFGLVDLVSTDADSKFKYTHKQVLPKTKCKYIWICHVSEIQWNIQNMYSIDTNVLIEQVPEKNCAVVKIDENTWILF